MLYVDGENVRRHSASTARSGSRSTAPIARTRSVRTGHDHALRASPVRSLRLGSPRATRRGTGSTRSSMRSSANGPRSRRRRRSRARCATELAEAFPLALDPIVESVGDDGQTVKWLWRCRTDDAQIETVLMRYPERATVCISSQAGCAMGCTFCATGQAGFVRHLDAGEIVEQVVRARARIASAGEQRGVHGHGRAARELRRDDGRRRTASTVISASRPVTSRSRPSESCPGSGGSRPRRCPSRSRSRCTRPTTSSATR